MGEKIEKMSEGAANNPVAIRCIAGMGSCFIGALSLTVTWLTLRMWAFAPSRKQIQDWEPGDWLVYNFTTLGGIVAGFLVGGLLGTLFYVCFLRKKRNEVNTARLTLVLGWYFFAEAMATILGWLLVAFGPLGPDPKLSAHWYAAEWVEWKIGRLAPIHNVATLFGILGLIVGAWAVKKLPRWAIVVGISGFIIAIPVAWFVTSDIGMPFDLTWFNPWF